VLLVLPLVLCLIVIDATLPVDLATHANAQQHLGRLAMMPFGADCRPAAAFSDRRILACRIFST